MDNRTLRNALSKRIPEVYFIARPWKAKGRVNWLMYAKIPPIKRPVKIIADMPDTAILSHAELLNTMIGEISDEIRKIKKTAHVDDDPYEVFPPLDADGQRIFDHDGIQFYE
jgi:hypothetical protein